MEIRSAVTADLEHVLKLWKQQYELHHALDAEYFIAYTPELEQKIQGYLENAVAKQNPLLFVAEHGGVVVGFVSCKEESETYMDTNITRYGFIYEIFVDPVARNLGAGRQLLAFVENLFAEKGITHVKLYSSVFNKPALDFYERTGYKAHQQVFLKQISG